MGNAILMDLPNEFTRIEEVTVQMRSPPGDRNRRHPFPDPEAPGPFRYGDTGTSSACGLPAA
jgi:hypothetical protein